MSYNSNIVRYSNIQMVDPPKEIIKWFNNQKYVSNKYSVSKLRDEVISLSDQEIYQIKIILKKEKMYARLNFLLQNEDRIKNSTDTYELIETLEKTEFVEIKILVINRLVEIELDSYKFFIKLLMKTYSNSVFDIVFKDLLKTMKKKDIFEEILGLLENGYISNPQDFSSLVQLMGYSKNEKALKYLYSYYEFFRNSFSTEDYYEGPLFAIQYYIQQCTN